MMQRDTPADLHKLHNLQRALDESVDLGAPARLKKLVHWELDHLPAPAGGATLQRWQALAAVAQSDLSLAKLYEGHTDALAIMLELGGPLPAPGAVWGMWAAEAPGHRVTITPAADGQICIDGSKAWCSGAATSSHALLTAWHPDGRDPQLVQVALQQPGVSISGDHWQAVGMQASASLEVRFQQANAVLVGSPGDYLQRPGFWHGGAGIAACWYGGSLALASALCAAVGPTASTASNPFRCAALGKVDLALQGTAALLRQAAHAMDDQPRRETSALALRLRQSAEGTARLVLDEVSRALGATPLCQNRHFARAAADLPVFIRQSHAERDFAALGERVGAEGATTWML